MNFGPCDKCGAKYSMRAWHRLDSSWYCDGCWPAKSGQTTKRVLFGHDEDVVIGCVTVEGDRVIVSIPKGVDEMSFWRTFGNIGVRFTNFKSSAIGEVRMVYEAEILEWSVPAPGTPMKDDPKPARSGHPIQPLEYDTQGILRFKRNAIVRHLLEHNDAGFDMNTLAALGFSNEDWTQFAQLIGYSLGGFSELSYVDGATYAEAEKTAEKLRRIAAQLRAFQ